MLSQLEALRLLAPEFDDVEDAIVLEILDLAPLFIDPMMYPESVRGIALVYQACILLLNRRQSESGMSSGGMLKREKEGDLEREYSVGSTTASTGANKYQISLDIYQQKLNDLSKGATGSAILTRFVGDVPTP